MNYHTLLHSLDIQKDAFHAEPSIDRKSPLFQACMMKLFGKDIIKNTYNRKKKQFSKNIENIPHPPSIPIKILQKPDLTVTYDRLPTYIQYAVQDAGISPNKYKDELIYVISPASYLDPGKRTFVPPNFQKDFNVLDIQSLHIPYLEEIKTQFDSENNCHVEIRFNFEKGGLRKLKVWIDRKYVVHGEDKKYFLGNPDKNKWFQDSANKKATNEQINEGILYILCKLLGDLLQVYYGKLFGDMYDTPTARVCVFTNDKYVQYRSYLYDVPVVLKNYNKNNNKIYESLYYPSSHDDPIKIKETLLRQINAENMSFLEKIKDVLLHGKIYVEDKVIIINTPIQNFLQECMITIEYCNRYVTHVHSAELPYNTFHELADRYQANCFIYIEGGKYYLVNNAFYFLKEEDATYDLIRRYNKNIYEIFISMSLSSKDGIIGGGEDYIHMERSIEQINEESVWKKLHNEVKRILLTYYKDDLLKYSIQLDKLFIGKNIRYDTSYSIDQIAHYHAMCICYTYETYFDVLGKVYLDERFLGFFCIEIYLKKNYDVLSHDRFLQIFSILALPSDDYERKKICDSDFDMDVIEDTMYIFPKEDIPNNMVNRPPPSIL